MLPPPPAPAYTHPHTQLFREIKQCWWNCVWRKFLDKLTVQLHYMTCQKMDEENLVCIMFCFKIAIYLRVLMDALLKHLSIGQASTYVTVAHDWWYPLLLPLHFCREFKQRGNEQSSECVLIVWRCAAWEHRLITFSPSWTAPHEGIYCKNWNAVLYGMKECWANKGEEGKEKKGEWKRRAERGYITGSNAMQCTNKNCVLWQPI